VYLTIRLCQIWALTGLLLLASCSAGASNLKRSAPTAAPQAAVPAALLTQAQTALAQYLGQPPTVFTLTAATAQDWPDGALGCPAPKTAYAQMIIPGYQLTFSAANQTYTLHTTQNGEQVVLCRAGLPETLAPASSLPKP